MYNYLTFDAIFQEEVLSEPTEVDKAFKSAHHPWIVATGY